MPGQEESKLFKLEVDEISKAHLLETGRWGKFLSIFGFIMIGIYLVGGYFYSIWLSSLYESLASIRISSMVFYSIFVISVAIIFYPVVALFNFSTKIKTGINTMNHEQFIAALRNLKGFFKYIGIITIVMLGLIGLMIIFALAAAAMN